MASDKILKACDAQFGASAGWYGDGFRALWLRLDQFAEVCSERLGVDLWGSPEVFLAELLGVDLDEQGREVEHDDSKARMRACERIEYGLDEEFPGQFDEERPVLEILTDEGGSDRIRADVAESLLDLVERGIVAVRERIVELRHSVQVDADPSIVEGRDVDPGDPEDYAPQSARLTAAYASGGPRPMWIPAERRERRFAVEVGGVFRWTPWVAADEWREVEIGRDEVAKAIEWLDDPVPVDVESVDTLFMYRVSLPYVVGPGFDCSLPLSPPPTAWRTEIVSIQRETVDESEIIVVDAEGTCECVNLEDAVKCVLWAGACPRSAEIHQSLGFVCVVDGESPRAVVSEDDPETGPTVSWAEPVDPRTWERCSVG